MHRPPIVSMLFFLAAPALLVALWLSTHGGETPGPASWHAKSAAPAQSRETRIRQFAATWPHEPNYAPVFNALDPSFDIIEVSASAFDPADDYFGLPRESGYDLVYGYCGSCHSLRIVMQQRATHKRWSELLDWMTEKQGMAEPPPGDRAVLIDYLAEHFGAAN